MSETHKTHFAPHLCIPAGVTDISFYEKAFGAVVLRCWLNDDGSIHVAELSIDGALFHIHEDKQSAGQLSPGSVAGTTVLVGLFVADVDSFVKRAVEAGAELISAPASYDYGYRQAEVKDPFGHVWLVEAVV